MTYADQDETAEDTARHQVIDHPPAGLLPRNFDLIPLTVLDCHISRRSQTDIMVATTVNGALE